MLRLALPLGWVLTLVIGFLVDAVAFWPTGWILPGFDVSLWSGLFGGIVVAFFNTIIIDVLNVNQRTRGIAAHASLGQAQPFPLRMNPDAD